MKAGKLDRRIVIQNQSDTIGTDGFRTTTWSTFLTVWSNVLHTTGKEKTENSDRSNERNVNFKVRYNSTITTQMRVVWNGGVYAVLDIKELGRKDGLLLITVLLTQT